MGQLVNIKNSLGNLPTTVSDQATYLSNLVNLLDTYLTEVKNNSPKPIVVSQENEPTQLEWESAWLAEHYLLPIPPAARLLWYDTYNDTFGGEYGTTLQSGTVYKREPYYPKGATVVLEQKLDTTIASTTKGIAEGEVSTALVFTLPTICDLILKYESFVTLSSGTGIWGVDFLLNGDKVGTTYFSVASDYGISNNTASGNLVTEILLKQMPAGDYTLQSLVGVCGSPASPPTLAIAPNNSQRRTSVRAIVND